jgi:1-deoxy-D-xylulose-5-phosphate reductoisomerase
VEAFLRESIRFTDIPVVVEKTLEQVTVVEPESLSVVETADSDARSVAHEMILGLR